MKKRLSFLIAVIMVLTMLPAMGVSAATTNRITPSGGSVADDHEWSGNPATVPFLRLTENQQEDWSNDEFIFSLRLSNAEWDFDAFDDAGAFGAGAAASTYNPGELAVTGAADASAIIAQITSIAMKNDTDYVLRVGSKTMVEVTVNEGAKAGKGLKDDGVLLIPLCVKMKGEGPATVTIADTSNTPITSASGITFATGISGTSKTTVASSDTTFNNKLTVDDITIAETTPDTIDGGLTKGGDNAGKIEFYAPSGFEWDDASLGADVSGFLGFSGQGDGDADFDIDDKDSAHLIMTHSFDSSTATRGGSILIKGLVIKREGSVADTPTGDVRVRVKVAGGSTEYITVGVFAGKGVTITAEDKALPELVSGLYTLDADDDVNQTLDVWVSASSNTAWNAGADAIFTLPEGVKFRAAQIKDTKNVTGFDKTDDSKVWLRTDGNGKIAPSEQTSNSGQVGLSQTQLTIKGDSPNNAPWTIDTNKNPEFKIRIWVTIKPGFTGDITLMADPDNDAFGTGASAVIAKAIDPFTVTTTSTDINLGYMNLPLADVVIKENKAGALPKSSSWGKAGYAPGVGDSRDYGDGQIFLWIGGYIGVDKSIGFKSEGKAEVTSGDLIIDNYTQDKGDLILTIKRESTTPSEIKLSGMTIDADRNVPQGKLELRIGGTVTSNFIPKTVSGDDKKAGGFDVEYFVAAKDYINVITSAPNVDVKYTTEVDVTIDSKTIKANGIDHEMDVAPFIRDGYTMVPVRAVAVALGIDDSQVSWDPYNKTVTIRDTGRGRNSQFKVGSNEINIGGITERFEGPSCEVVDGRTFLPFRVLGEKVLGCPVDWDETTRTASFNKAK